MAQSQRERALPTGGGARAESQYSRERACLECLRVACRPNAAWLCQHGGTWEDVKSQNQVINYELRVVCFFVLFTKVKLLCLFQLFFPRYPVDLCLRPEGKVGVLYQPDL